MKVMLFTDTLGDLNGVSRFIQDMGELANRSGYQFIIVTATTKKVPDKPYIINLPVRFKIPMPFYQELDIVWPSKKAISAVLAQEKPDLVHISTPGSFGWAAKRIAERNGYPLIGTYHTDFPAYLRDLTGSDWVKQRTDYIMQKFYRPFKHVFSRSENYLEVMASDLGINYDKSSVIYPGTQLKKFNPVHFNADVWKTFGLSKKRLKVLYVGRVNVEKNIPFLIDVWKTLQANYPAIEADLVMVGEGRYRKWADKVRRYHAYFLGPVEGQALSYIYASADLFVFPSVTDTLGQVVMEAQASGLYTLVSDVGGPQTLINEPATGKVLKANSILPWVESMAQYLENAEKSGNAKQAHKLKLMNPNSDSACVEHMQQYNIETSFNHFIEKHQTVYENIIE